MPEQREHVQASACPEAESLAAYIDGRLSGAARAEIEAHMASCPSCYETFVETERLQGENGSSARVLTHRRFSTRTALVTVSGLLATAAAIVLVVRLAQPSWWVRLSAPRSDRPELAELVAAVANEPTRPVEGRLVGGFRYAPPPSPMRGPGDREASPDVRIAAAKIEKVARAHDTPENEAALGVAYLALRDYDKAIDALESAVEQKTTDARFQTDLSAAYVARARWRDRAEDWPKALAAAERAIKVDPKLVEPYFNRALALEGLHLREEALNAWATYLALERSPGWSEEAGQRAKTLKVPSGSASLGSAIRDHQAAREPIEDELLVHWAEAIAAGDESLADSRLWDAESAARALVESGGDTMARDEIALIRRAVIGHRGATVRALAAAHLLYGRARQEYLNDRYGRASELMSEASRDFGRVSSSYAFWGPVYQAIVLWVSGSGAEALTELSRISVDTLPVSYFHLRGRCEWTRGMAFESLGRYDLARHAITLAVEAFQRGGELENLTVNQSYLAQTEWLLGDRIAMWTHQIAALGNLDSIRVSPRRNIILINGMIISLGEGLPESALRFQNTLVRSVESSNRRSGLVDAYMRRAEALLRLGNQKGALEDLARAQRSVPEIADERFRAWGVAELDRVRADALHITKPVDAVAAASAALEYYRRMQMVVRTTEVLVLRAKALEAKGEMETARRDYQAAVDEFERDRAGLSSTVDRLQAFEEQRAAFRELIRFEAVALADEREALRTAERGRARGLLENLTGDTPRPLDPAIAYASLPSDVAIVYYVTLDDRVLTWVLTREAVRHFVRSIPLSDLEVQISRLHRLIRRGADVGALGIHSSMLFKDLVEPALRLAAGKTMLVFVPDGPLSKTPFGAIPDAHGHPLIARYTVTMAPSLTTFLMASMRLSRVAPVDALAVGDGQNPDITDFPRLTGANQEAVDVGRLYPSATVLIGPEATKRRFFAERRSVIHFSGHTVVNEKFPMFSRIMLAPDPRDGDDGTLLASDIAQHRFDGTHVVVLGSCDGAAGRLIDGEGVASVARTFLDAGVPSVIASLWPVDDQARSLLTTVHRELRSGRDAATALREAQLMLLRARGRETPIRLWGGFVALGGLSSPQP